MLIGPRVILHVDMDAFYASVEQRDHPELRGKPVIVGGTSGRGVVAAASYEVRVFGVRSAMPVSRALQLCPHAICVQPRMGRYAEVSAQIFDIFHEFTPLVEGLSLDEAYLDVTASLALKGDAVSIAREIKLLIRERTGLNASVGIAPNKLVAKIASDLEKPDGLTVVAADRIIEILAPLSIKRLPGLGRKKGDELIALGVKTIGDLQRASDSKMERWFGRHALHWRERACGVDDRTVEPDHEEKSVSNEQTYATDLTDERQMLAEISVLSDKVSSRLRRKGLRARCVGIKIRRADFVTFSRQKTLATATDETRIIVMTADELLRAFLREKPRTKIRLLGVATSEFGPDDQPDLFSQASSTTTAIDSTVDAIREKFGGTAVARASGLLRQGDRSRSTPSRRRED